LPVKKE